MSMTRRPGACSRSSPIPAAVGGAQATGVNNSQQVCGFYIDSSMVNHGFLLNFGQLTTLDPPGASSRRRLA